MKNFEHVNAVSVKGAVKLLDPVGNARAIAGGTDLLTEMKSRLVSPDRLINLKTIPDMDGISYSEKNGLQIGAMSTLSSISENEDVKTKYPVLLRAILSVATLQIRNRGTIGGNLLQDSRCWYYRGPFKCWLKGGEFCYARDGENMHHAIFSDGPCYTVHPSDTAVALITLGANVKIVSPNGDRTIPIEELYQYPHEGHRRLTILNPSEIIRTIQFPSPGQNSRGTYLKAMERKVWAFALVSVGAQVTLEKEIVKTARIVIGGVAPTPYIVPGLVTMLVGKELAETAINATAEHIVSGAKPLPHNKFKVPLVREMVKQALNSLK